MPPRTKEEETLAIKVVRAADPKSPHRSITNQMLAYLRVKNLNNKH